MKRRDFLSITIPATGAILMAPGVSNARVMSEINKQFSGPSEFDAYDIVINGAGLAGYFSALQAAKQKKKVLLVEKRSSPGFEFFAQRKLWVGAAGLDKLSGEDRQLFLPEGEQPEIKSSGGQGPGASTFGDEVLLFSGSIRKGLLRNLLVSNVHVLLMTDVCGVAVADDNVQGVLLAGKHGLHMVRCKSFIDASDQLLLTRGLFNSPSSIKSAGFVLELSKVKNPVKKEVLVSDKFGVLGNKLAFHRGKMSDEQLFIRFEFPVTSQNYEDVEHQARLITAALGKALPSIDSSLKDAEINEYATEASIVMEPANLSAPKITGYHTLEGLTPNPTFESVIELKASAQALVSKLKYSSLKVPQDVLTIGSRIPYGQLTVADLDEPGLRIPLKTVTFDLAKNINNRLQCQVLVAGGGTGGAFAAVGAAERGANTIVVDYFNDLGGTKTMGGVMGYYHGVKDNAYFKKQTEDAERFAFEANMTKKTGRKIYHLNSMLDNNGRFVGGAIVCGALVSENNVRGIIVCRNGRLEVIEAHVTIDATGDGDIAAFAGGEFSIGNTRTGETQNYSQWDIPGSAKLSSPTNRDYDIIDNTKVGELQRGLFISHYEAHFYDFHPMLTVRESRRVTGMYVLDFLDVAEKTHHKDVIALASSDFDPHNVGSSEYTKCGFLLPHSNDVVVEIPYRCIVPKTLDGLLISGRGISQTHNALQFTRMTADIIVLGYLTGQIAADLSFNKLQPRQYDVSNIQKYWSQLGYLPSDYTRESTGDKRERAEVIAERIRSLSEGKREYLYECVRLPKEKALPVLADHCNESVPSEGKLLVAKALAWFGNSEGNDLIEDELKRMFDEESKTGYPDGYIDNYDSIRGREKNVLEGLFWRINQNIGLLAMSGSPTANPTVRQILDKTVSGGGMVPRTSDYYNHRIDLKLIPFYNRIMNLCFYAERLPDSSFIKGFEKLLTDKNVGGFKTEEYSKVRWRVFGGLLEVSIAAALARCGGKKGYELLVDYLDDTHYTFKSFAAKELQALTGKDLGYDARTWKKYTSGLKYPAPVNKLVKEVEV